MKYNIYYKYITIPYETQAMHKDKINTVFSHTSHAL